MAVCPVFAALCYNANTFAFFFAQQAERDILKGPNEDLQGFLDAVDRLKSIVRFFSSNKSYKSSDGVLNHANGLLGKAIMKMENEFQKQLTSRRFVFLDLLDIQLYFYILVKNV